MSVQVITSNYPSNAVALDRPSSASAPSPNKSVSASSPEKIRTSEVQPDSVGQVNPTFQSLSETNVKINQVADSVRQADATMQEVGRTVDLMKGSLEGIIKNYPPFPPGSEQRVRALKEFSAFRREIEKMTYPPEPSLVPKLISDPAKSPGSFSVTLDSKGTNIRLDRHQVDPGPNGLNIPVLPTAPPEDSADEPIHNAISVLENAAKTVSDRRQSLSVNFTQQALPAVAASVTNQTALSGAALGTTTFSEQSASSKSRDISGIFSAITVGMSLTNDSFLKRIT
jgi:hypothetical protein